MRDEREPAKQLVEGARLRQWTFAPGREHMVLQRGGERVKRRRPAHAHQGGRGAAEEAKPGAHLVDLVRRQ